MKVVKINQINKIIEVLLSDGVVALPTDTAYALAADVTNPKAVNKVFKIKGRSKNKLLSWFFDDIGQIKKYCQLTNYQLSILNFYLPGPYTFIVQGKNGQTVGARITNDPITQAVVKAFGKPLTATSANRSGEPPIRMVDELKKLPINLIIDGGTIPNNLPSTVIDLTFIPPKILRLGLGKFPKK